VTYQAGAVPVYLLGVPGKCGGITDSSIGRYEYGFSKYACLYVISICVIQTNRSSWSVLMAEKSSYAKLHEHIQGLDTADEKLSILVDLFNLSVDLLCVADFEGYFRMFNSAFENTLGYSREELLKTPFIEFVHPDDRETTLDAMKRLASGETVHNFENRYCCKDGSYKWFAWNSVPGVEERVTYAVARDITEQKTIEQELVAQRDLFQTVLSNVPASIFWKDRNSVYLGVNERFAKDAGFRHPEDLVGKTDYDLSWTKEEADFYRECDRKVMDSCEPMLNIEESQQQTDGRVVNLLTNKVPLLDSTGQVYGMLGIYMDITKLKQAEDEVQRYQQELSHITRLGTMGEMASGMAHELNQPLTALVSYCGTAISLLKTLSSPPQQLREILERAGDQAHRASDIIRHLREFVSKGDNQRELYEIDQSVHGIIKLLKHDIQDSGVTIEFYPGCQGCKVMADKIQIDQVLVNIVRNGIEAIKNAKISEGRIVLHSRLLPNDSVEVTVADNGTGIDASIVDVIFDPFQTSKKTGMGVGLSLSRSIIEAHGGKLWLDKSYSSGALFGFVLPVSN
jgi:two-component system cell cycle sensor histidine kinase/response regulator CckA